MTKDLNRSCKPQALEVAVDNNRHIHTCMHKDHRDSAIFAGMD
jgi:hypothetical protein